ncbi:hypothetical protein PFAG_02004 [Plasmodium falciparum Santa Lucia]|uniref:Uncharacterized protein n=1 Tax=Plasmodium falciparum Santa Lucia TaxID=478859 RepID=W7FRI0_PLAFA|nr:hypothetical protein PFAG_02004 [Plasmodium falciparum Santa Lucia]
MHFLKNFIHSNIFIFCSFQRDKKAKKKKKIINLNNKLTYFNTIYNEILYTTLCFIGCTFCFDNRFLYLPQYFHIIEGFYEKEENLTFFLLHLNLSFIYFNFFYLKYILYALKKYIIIKNLFITLKMRDNLFYFIF